MTEVSVRRLSVDCTVPRDHPNPLAVRTKLDEAAAHLPAALGRLLAPLERAGDEVVVIRRLELAIDLDTSLSPGELARAWAARIAAAVARSLAPESRVPLVRFPDDVHYLARFLADSVAARATGAWYYRRWHGLDALPIAAQLRTAIGEAPARGIAALAALAPSELVAVLSTLGPREARRVIEEAIAAEPEGDLDAAARVLTPLVPAWLPLAASLASPWQAALALAARAAEALHQSELRPMLQLAAALAVTCGPGGAASRAARVEIAPLEARVEIAASPPGAVPTDAPPVEPLLAVDAEVRRALLAAAHPAEVSEGGPAPGWYTRLGGLLLLLPRIAELPLDRTFGAGAPCARLVLLSRAAGHLRRAEVLADPMWRHLCGVAPDADIDAWLAGDTVASAFASLAAHRALRHADALRLIATRWCAPVAILAGDPDGDWLALAPLTPALRAELRAARIEGPQRLGPARSAAQVLAWLEPDLASPVECALAATAQQVLRAFARRLPGFAASSPAFLYDNFLDFDATILETAGAFHCRIGRPRLAAVFGLTGALRGRLPIGDDRTVELSTG